MKLTTPPVHFITAQSLGATYTSPTINVLQADGLCIQLNYATGSSPVGAFSVQGSLDQVNWTPLYFSIAGTSTNSITIPSNTSPILLDINVTNIPYLQVVYTRTSGTTTLDGFYTYKRIGD